MYMERIEIPVVAAVAERDPKPVWLKVPVGFVFLLVCAVLMVGWSVVVATWMAFALTGRAIAGTATFASDLLIYSGEAVLGR